MYEHQVLVNTIIRDLPRLRDTDAISRDSDEIMGRRNKVAKHIKSRADAGEAMLVLCHEGKVDETLTGIVHDTSVFGRGGTCCYD
jgi:hypothetical protein